MSHALTALSTFLSIRRTRHWSRDRLMAWQERKIEKWLKACPSRCRAFKGPVGSLRDIPVMDKATLMNDFAAYNQPGITAHQGWAAFEGSRMVDGYHVGASTGTSGNRGLFVISDKERYAWLGAMLGKALPDFWKTRNRVAVILPLHTRLYDTANGFGPLRLSFFDVTAGPESWIDELVAFAPTHIIAPPRILRYLVDVCPPPRRAFSAAEVLDEADARKIADWAPLGQIYMATEGVIGVSCEHGTLHLCEDIMNVELEPVGNLVSPIITDFRRTTQAMARYRMNDLLEMGTCSCGSPHRAIKAVHGRRDDCLRFGDKEITPDVVRNAIVDSNRQIEDFRVIQEGEALRLELMPGVDGEPARTALEAALARLGVCVCVDVVYRTLNVSWSHKLRRVVRR